MIYLRVLSKQVLTGTTSTRGCINYSSGQHSQLPKMVNNSVQKAPGVHVYAIKTLTKSEVFSRWVTLRFYKSCILPNFFYDREAK